MNNINFEWLNAISEKYSKENSFQSKVEFAIAFANVAHAGHIRKGTTIPYIFHVMNVGKILAEDLQCSEDIVVAGILHDTIEDTKVTEEDIQRNFGENVLRLVKGNSERDKSDTWENRKKEAIEHAQNKTEDVLLIKLADKFDNISAIARDQDEIGEDIWERFNAPKDRLFWYYFELGKIFLDKLTDKKAAELTEKYLRLVENVFLIKSNI